MSQPSGAILTALFADGDRGRREAVKLYASVQKEIRLVAVVGSGRDLLQRLQDAVAVDVLIVDALLPDMGIFDLLFELARMRLKEPPAVLVTLCAANEAMRHRLLTAGADFIILKPYHLASLFDTALYTANTSQSLQERRARSHINWHLAALKAPASMEGTDYIRWILSELVLRTPTATADELYRTIAMMESHTTPNTISKAVGRSVQAIWKQASQEYLDLCEYFGEGTDKPLSNMKLIKGLAVRIRWELGL